MTASGHEVEPGGYDDERDFAESLNAAYAAVRARMKNGGPPWLPKLQDQLVCAP
jgi:hypothetical protein